MTSGSGSGIVPSPSFFLSGCLPNWVMFFSFDFPMRNGCRIAGAESVRGDCWIGYPLLYVRVMVSTMCLKTMPKLFT